MLGLESSRDVCGGMIVRVRWARDGNWGYGKLLLVVQEIAVTVGRTMLRVRNTRKSSSVQKEMSRLLDLPLLLRRVA